ncbi:hypothetical protein VKS41_005778 [Umbelopsis sp. WA50703]
MPCYEFQHGEVDVSTDASRIDMDFVVRSLKLSYWAGTRPVEIVRRTWSHSLQFGIYERLSGTQVAMMRVVTDYGHYAHCFDVWVDPQHRGKGYSKLLMSFYMDYPELKDVTRFQLTTWDAHTLYGKYGFAQLKEPERFLELKRNLDNKLNIAK